MSNRTAEARRDDVPATSANLGCGTWVILALVVLFAVKAATNDLEHEVGRLSRDVRALRADLRSASETLEAVSVELRELRAALPERARAAEEDRPVVDPEKR